VSFFASSNGIIELIAQSDRLAGVFFGLGPGYLLGARRLLSKRWAERSDRSFWQGFVLGLAIGLLLLAFAGGAVGLPRHLSSWMFWLPLVLGVLIGWSHGLFIEEKRLGRLLQGFERVLSKTSWIWFVAYVTIRELVQPAGL